MQILEKLEQARVHGDVGPVVSLFSWRNGSKRDASLTLEQASPFPNSIYTFPDLELMIRHFQALPEMLAYHLECQLVGKQFFPIFWGGSTSYLAVDLERSLQNRIVLIDPETEDVMREAYGTFELFLKDAILANQLNRSLTCFKESRVKGSRLDS